MRTLATLAGFALLCTTGAPLHAQFTRADSLRGATDSPTRNWWDVTYYDLALRVNPADSTVRGSNAITYRVLRPARELQVDLQAPLRVDSMLQDGRRVPVRQEGSAWFATLPSAPPAGESRTLTVHYSGRPTIARRPPWEGGITWASDSLGRPWIVTTAQGIGASVWWPNKETQADEPDSQRVAVTAPSSLRHVGAGRPRSSTVHADGTTTHEWFSSRPINNYAIALAIGSYGHWRETFDGEAGPLTMDFHPLDYNEARARRQFTQAASTLRCFEHWFGPYPWYEDGFKLIEVPNTGMEHQTAVTYGNHYANGYRGRDLSGTGWGMEWDFIIVHETAHEWWGNSITTVDLADMWVHESFANYSEGLYTECLSGKAAGAEYIRGSRRGIQNDVPIIPAAYGVNAKGSGDMYPKGGALLHMIRQWVDDDEQWRTILRGLQSTFRHRIVTGADVERFISERAGRDLSRVFDQYLRDVRIPVLEYAVRGREVQVRWTNVVPEFVMPVRVLAAPERHVWVEPSTEWMTITVDDPGVFAVDPDFYVDTRLVAPPGRAPDRE